MKLRHLPAVLVHSPWFTLRNGPKMWGHIFRGATIKSLLGLENEKRFSSTTARSVRPSGHMPEL